MAIVNSLGFDFGPPWAKMPFACLIVPQLY
jgi:hypothetical protein